MYISTVSPHANLTEVSINRTYEQGENATLECNGIGGPDNIYQWQNDGENIENENSTILMLINVTASTGGVYICVVSNAAGNHSASTLLFVSPYFLKQPKDRVLTSVGLMINVECVAAAFPNPEYQWGHEDGRQIRMGILINMSILTISSLQFEDGGNYYCNVSSNGVMNTSASVLVIGELT